ncbi:hypothetical protein [Chryseobacterium indologenes]
MYVITIKDDKTTYNTKLIKNVISVPCTYGRLLLSAGTFYKNYHSKR